MQQIFTGVPSTRALALRIWQGFGHKAQLTDGQSSLKKIKPTNVMKDASMVREGLLEVVTFKDQRGDSSR